MVSLTLHKEPELSTPLDRVSSVQTVPIHWRQFASEETIPEVKAEQRFTLMISMREELSCNEGKLTSQNLNLMKMLAEYLCDWVFLVRILELLIKNLKNDHSLAGAGAAQEKTIFLSIQQAYCYGQLGEFTYGLWLLEQALLASPYDSRLLTAYDTLKKNIKSMALSINDFRVGPLLLTPLQEQHSRDFCWQYADPTIAELCHLPTFESDEDWFEWLRERKEQTNLHLFAVVHQEWGFIGCVSLEVFQGLGFFYYWLGHDFQGNGFGPQAVEQLLHLGEKYFAVDCCYAKVFKRNHHSKKAILKLGFLTLPFKIKTEGECEEFYYLGPKIKTWESYKELTWLLNIIAPEVEVIGRPECFYS